MSFASFLCDISSIDDVAAIIYQSENPFTVRAPSSAPERISRRDWRPRKYAYRDLDNRECNISSKEDL